MNGSVAWSKVARAQALLFAALLSQTLTAYFKRTTATLPRAPQMAPKITITTHSADRCTPSGCDRYREGYSRLRVIVINEFIQLRRELPGHSIRIGYLPVII